MVDTSVRVAGKITNGCMENLHRPEFHIKPIDLILVMTDLKGSRVKSNLVERS